MQRKLLEKIINSLEKDESEEAKMIVQKGNEYLKLSESIQEEPGVSVEPSAIEALEVLLKTILDQITDSIIDKVVDNKLEPEEQMKEHIQSLDESMDYIYAMGQHFSKMLMQHSDEGMKSLYTKAHTFSMKLADLMKEHRKGMDAESEYKEKDNLVLSEAIDDKVKVLSEQLSSTKEMAQESMKMLSEQLTQKDNELSSLKAQIAAKEKVSLIEDAIKAKKLLPSMKQWALSMTSENLKGFLELAPIMNVSTDKYTDVAPSVIPMEKEMALSESDMYMIKELGITKEQFIAGKKKKGY